jgi:replicative superfamily II helicase
MLLCRALNRIQSTIFEKAFSSNENILVCAPTGAGKTNIAMLTVLHEIAANMSDGIIQASASSHCARGSRFSPYMLLMS